MMRDLSPNARSVLQRYRVTESLREGEKDRLLEVLEQRGARGDLPKFRVNVPPPVVPTVAAAPWIFHAPLGKVLMGVGVLAGLSVPVLRKEISWSNELSNAVDVVRGPRSSRSFVGRLQLSAPSVASDASTNDLLDTEQTSVKPPSRTLPARSEKKDTSVQTAKPPAQEATIDEEVRLLKAAQGFLRAGQPWQALTFLDDHAARFPHGKMSDARDVARMMALCDLGQTSIARKQADRFLAEHPGSPFSEGVRRLCLPKE
jgi:hypothetical protein